MIGRMKLHVETGVLDASQNVILTGDDLVDSAGNFYYVNSYCQAVPYGEGKAQSVADIVRRSVVYVATVEQLEASGFYHMDETKRKTPRPMRAEEPKPEKPKVAKTKADKPKAVKPPKKEVPEKPDDEPEAREKVEWLRSHGYDVTCTKVVTYTIQL